MTPPRPPSGPSYSVQLVHENSGPWTRNSPPSTPTTNFTKTQTLSIWHETSDIWRLCLCPPYPPKSRWTWLHLRQIVGNQGNKIMSSVVGYFSQTRTHSSSSLALSSQNLVCHILKKQAMIRNILRVRTRSVLQYGNGGGLLGLLLLITEHN